MNYHHLSKTDPDIWRSVKKEISRQQAGLEMIASENIVSMAVLEALGTPLVNKYSEGYFSKRYYSGNEFIDEIEMLAIERAKKLFSAEHANVQPHSGSQANQAVYLALLNPGDTVLAMNLAHGGHLTHGSPVNFSGKIYKFVHYGVRRDTELVDMEEVAALAREHKPKLIVAGYSAYPRRLDFAAFRKIADEVGALLMVDMAHFAGLVAGGVHPSPVPYADVVTTTTHKTLRGPRGAMILCKAALAKKIDSAVFPGIQGGPLDQVVAAKAVSFKEALDPKFAEYQRQVVLNARVLADRLAASGFKLVSGGTDNHLVLMNLEGTGLSGADAEKLLDTVGIYTNKNMVPFDTGTPQTPSGLRLGTPALTTRGMKEPEMREVGELIAKTLNDWKDIAAIEQVRTRVADLAAAFPIIYPELS